MEKDHEDRRSEIQFEEQKLVTETMMGDFITPTVVLGRIASVLAQHPDGLSTEDLLSAVQDATPEVTAHPTLEIDTPYIEGYLDSLRGLGLDIYTDEHGKIRYFATELDI